MVDWRTIENKDGFERSNEIHCDTMSYYLLSLIVATENFMDLKTVV